MDAVDEIKGRLTIDDVVGQYVDLKRSGSSLKGLCPFHGEKTPSFYVSPARGTYHCFGCGKGGDIFSFVMDLDRIAFPDALKRLAEQAGVQLPERDARKPSLKNRLYEANEAAAQYFHEALTGPHGGRARDYLSARRFAEDAVHTFQLGYAPTGGDALIKFLQPMGFDDRLLLAAGLVYDGEGKSPIRDRFRGRLMFPIRDAAGHVVGFGGRTLGDDQPKYLNSPQTEIFDKSSVLFGIHRARDAFRSAGRAVLVEGYLDAIRAHVSGQSNVVASLGTAITARQLEALNRQTEQVIIALDPDPAGQSAAARAALTALADVTKERGRASGEAGVLDLRIARLPDGRGDPDELIREHLQEWNAALDASVPAFEFFFQGTMDSLDRSSDGWRQQAIDRLLPLIQQFSQSTGWQAVWIERLAREAGIDPGMLQRSLAGTAPPRQRRRANPQDGRGRDVVTTTTARGLTSDARQVIEQSLLTVLVKMVVIPDAAAELLSGVTLQHHDHQALLEHLMAWRESGNYDYEMFRETLSADMQRYADELHNRNSPPPDSQVSITVQLHLVRLDQTNVKLQLQRAEELLHDISPEEQVTALRHISELTVRKGEVDQSLHRLHQQAGARRA